MEAFQAREPMASKIIPNSDLGGVRLSDNALFILKPVEPNP